MTGSGKDPSDTDCEALTLEAYKKAGRGRAECITQSEFVDYCRSKCGGECKNLESLQRAFGLLGTPEEEATKLATGTASGPEDELPAPNPEETEVSPGLRTVLGLDLGVSIVWRAQTDALSCHCQLTAADVGTIWMFMHDAPSFKIGDSGTSCGRYKCLCSCRSRGEYGWWLGGFRVSPPRKPSRPNELPTSAMHPPHKHIYMGACTYRIHPWIRHRKSLVSQSRLIQLFNRQKERLMYPPQSSPVTKRKMSVQHQILRRLR